MLKRDGSRQALGSLRQDYEERSRHMADWLEQLFNRYYMPTYSKERTHEATDAWRLGPAPAVIRWRAGHRGRRHRPDPWLAPP